VRNLLAGGRMRPAIGLWASCFFFSFAIYTLMQWLPTIVAEAGGDPGRAGSSLGLFKLGGIVSSLALAAYIDRRTNPYPLMTMFLALSVVPVLMLGRASPTSTVFTISVGLAGILLGGLQYAWNALIARLFPTSVRAAGVAVYKGFAAVGALIGPLLAGVLLQLGWTASDVLAALIVPIAMAMFTVAWLSLSARKRA
jgi:MFS family permease